MVGDKVLSGNAMQVWSLSNITTFPLISFIVKPSLGGTGGETAP